MSSKKSSNLPVIPMNFTAMKALLEENRRLREQLDEEKSKLSTDITSLQNHINQADQLAKSSRIEQELADQFKAVSSCLDSPVIQPNLTFIKAVETPYHDLSEELKTEMARYEDLHAATIEIAEKRTELAVEEQKIHQKNSSSLQNIAEKRRVCDALILEHEKITHEVTELESLLKYWQKRNKSSSEVLKTAMSDLNSLQQAKDAEAIQLLDELQTIYATLDEASRKLKEQAII